jgi:hypothetical protein
MSISKILTYICVCLYILSNIKKSLKMPKRQSESVYRRRTDSSCFAKISSQIKDYKIGIFSFSARYVASRSKSKDSESKNACQWSDQWIWLTVTEYLCHKWPRICSIFSKHFPVLSSIMTYHRVYNWSNTTSSTSGARTACHSVAHEFIPRFLVRFVLLDL